MSFKRSDLVNDLEASLHDAGNVFQDEEADAAFIRFLDLAALDLSRFRPYRVKDSITLVADQADYTAPAGLISVIQVLYGAKERAARKAWDSNYPQVPTVKKIGDDTTPVLLLMPAPTAAMITDLGATFEFICSKQHVISETAASTTITAVDKGLLILRAQAEAAKEMAMRNISKPVTMRDGVSGLPRNATPAALYRQLLEDFERMTA